MAYTEKYWKDVDFATACEKIKEERDALRRELEAAKAEIVEFKKNIEEHNAAMNKVPSRSRPETLEEGLRFLAEWFDAFYGDAGTGADVVQHDLRRWACDIDRLIARLDAATDGKWHEDEIEAAKYRASKQACEIGWCDHAKLAESLRCALENIAKQKLSSELLAKDDSEYENADFECGYDEIVKIAREAVKLANL